jgi:tRNA pseudouridine38/39 synthase
VTCVGICRSDSCGHKNVLIFLVGCSMTSVANTIVSTTYHPVLVELGVVAATTVTETNDGSTPQQDHCRKKSGSPTAGSKDDSTGLLVRAEAPPPISSTQGGDCIVTALDLLNHLLYSEKVSIESLRESFFLLSSSAAHQQRPDPGMEAEPATVENGEGNPCGNTSSSLHSSCSGENGRSSANGDSGPSLQANKPQPDQSLQYRRRHIALQIYYDGGEYSGLAQNVGIDSDRSIEKSLFQALQRAHFVESRETSGYSRCGRTDRGVSALGQVVALQLKSAFHPQATWDPEGTTEIASADLPSESFQKVTVYTPTREKKGRSKQQESMQSSRPEDSCDLNVAEGNRQKKEQSEYSYDTILNKLLPDDIRVLGWCPVSDDFSARFSATTRTYRYFFVRHIGCASGGQKVVGNRRGDLDLERIQTGLNYLIGTHDFRNFCKMDVEKVYNFVRRIDGAQVWVMAPNGENIKLDPGNQEIPPDSEQSKIASASGGSSLTTVANKQICFLEIIGQAFLWHQIRCIASIIFEVGRGFEPPEIVPELLNVSKYPGKPAYSLAPERPLVLHHCGFSNLTFGYNVVNLWCLTHHFEQQYTAVILEAARIRNALLSLMCHPVPVAELKHFVLDRRRGGLKSKIQPSDPVQESPIEGRQTVSWQEVCAYFGDLEQGRLLPIPEGGTDGSILKSALPSMFTNYVSILERSKGTTYEEKVESLKFSDRRRVRYEENVLKKRKSREEDEAFYSFKAKQGGS